jgi:hypothetical protein
MRAVELEGRVVAAIEARRNAKVSPEDDFVECKGRWPEKDKARQLAGLANRAAGEPVVLIVGFDDRSGAVVDPGPTDPADWWQAMVGQFDQTPLDMVRHMLVHISPTEKVHAFAFGTDRVPYVVKNGQGRDVPMRDGTSTRSAYRHELLRLLLPSVSTPPTQLLAARMQSAGDISEGTTRSRSPLEWSGSMTCFVEHLNQLPVMIPAHEMYGSLSIGDTSRNVRVTPYAGPVYVGERRPKVVSAYGAEVRADGIVITGSARITLTLRAAFSREDIVTVSATEAAQLSVHLGVTGSGRSIKLNADMRKQAKDSSDGAHLGRTGVTFALAQTGSRMQQGDEPAED